ncbi:MAG TPA: VWA domain-containing protein [Campylobacterales bacterium]|nr:VWA domain-containing protein [Campylobacterales bacterium]HIP60002.1 VWA domain-containing protein [Campylobacterales bacterium]
MILLRPDYILFMMIPALILFFFIIIHKNNINAIFDEKMLEKLTFDNGSLGRMGRNFMLFIALFLMIIALARPAIEKGDVKIKSKKIDLLIALDISKSMLASDIYPNRLEFAKKKIYEFIDSFKEANVGVIAFSSEGFLVSPMTQDSATLKYLIGNLSLESLSTAGTNLLIPIQKGASFLKDSKQKIIIIFTDGGDNESFEKELEATKNANEHIYIYATATNGGAPITENGVSIKDKEGNIVITKLNEKIKTLAIESGGAYIVGGLKDDSVSILVEDIKKKFKMQDTQSRKIKEYKELFYYPLGFGIFFMLLAFSSFPKRSYVGIFVLLVLGINSPKLHAGVFDFQTIDKADEAYQNEEYKEAIESYKEVVKSKKSPQSFYDLANAQYKDKKYEQALSTYNKVTSKDSNLEYKKLFNSGNSHFQLKKYEEALKAYEKAKKINNEADLEHNIQLAKKMIEKKKKEQDKKDNKQKKDDDKKDDDKKNKQDKKDKQDDAKDGDKDKDSAKKQEEPKKKKEEKISEKEAKKWEQQLEKMKPKTMPMQFQNYDIERTKNEKPW